MKRYSILLCAVLPTAAWFASTSTDLASAGFMLWQHEIITAIGLTAYLMFTICMVLATRPAWLEQRIGGLDKGYLLHKWMGITGAILVFGHWMLEIVPKAMVKAGWLARPSHGPRPAQALDFLREPAVHLGEWAAYVMLALAVIALIKWVPYHWFRRLHKVFPAAFLVATFHGLILLPQAAWLTPAGLLLAVCALVGSAASVFALFGRIGERHQHEAVISSVTQLSGNVIEIECRVSGKGLSHRPGQFVFAHFAGNRDPHPFTIASSGSDPRRIRFCVKALGDDSRAMLHRLRADTPVTVEGPYGCFDFSASSGEQVWIGAGIGVTPFLARLEKLAEAGSAGQPVTFYYCAPADNPFTHRVRALCERAGVRLHLIDAERDGLLDLDKVVKPLRQIGSSHLWFCGPSSFGDQLERAWRGMGLAARNFHREHFAMR